MSFYLDPKDDKTRTSQGTTVAGCLAMLDRYSDSIEGKNELHCGLLMCNHAMREAAELLRLLAPDHEHEEVGSESQ